MTSLELTVPPQVEAIPHVREQVTAAVRDLLDQRRAADLRLVVSEVVTNAIVHGGGGEPVVVIVRAGDGVCVEVVDGGPGFEPGSRTRPRDEPGGWGLQIVRELADRWGRDTVGGTRVWFSFEAPAVARAAATR